MANTAVVKRSDIEGTDIELSAAAEMVVSRQAQEVQAAMVIAKKFPRDITRAFGKIMESCKRKSLAEVACYEYPRGGTKVTGPSIRLAEAMAQNWGNLDFGVIELEQRHRESTVMAYCWDLETNTRQTKIFQVKHERYSKDKGNAILTDPRDIYEMVANQGARRVRACILGIIPGDIQDAAVAQCDDTMRSDSEPIADKIRKMVASFVELGVTQDDIEGLLLQKLDACTERDIVRLRKIYISIKDGMSKKEDHFRPAKTATEAAPQTGTKAEQLANKLKQGGDIAGAALVKHIASQTPQTDAGNVGATPQGQAPAPNLFADQVKADVIKAIEARRLSKGSLAFSKALKACGLSITKDETLEKFGIDALNQINEAMMG